MLKHHIRPNQELLEAVPVSKENSIREILLTQGQVAIVDEEDYALLSQYKWKAHKRKTDNTFYADTHTSRKNPPRVTLRMHRVILGICDPRIMVDHIDGNGLNNSRKNLRIATAHQNQGNRSKNRGNFTSTFRGVCKIKGKWVMQIGTKPRVSIRCESEINAARLYDEYAINYWGEFARLNFPVVSP